MGHQILHFPTSLGVSEQTSEQMSAAEHVSEVSERASGASERANGRASGPVLQSVFLADVDHSALDY